MCLPKSRCNNLKQKRPHHEQTRVSKEVPLNDETKLNCPCAHCALPRHQHPTHLAASFSNQQQNLLMTIGCPERTQ
eukprot:511803-Pelagomonas_calceolata.AAC.1